MQGTLRPASGVSPLIVVVPQPVVLVSPPGVQVQRSVTLLECQFEQSTCVRFESVQEGSTSLACAGAEAQPSAESRRAETIAVRSRMSGAPGRSDLGQCQPQQ